MIAYYDTDGKYVWTGNATVAVEGAPPPPKHPFYSVYNVYEGAVDKDSEYHDTSTGKPVAMPAKPSAAHVFDWKAKSWRDPRVLADFQAAQWTGVKAARDAALTAPLETPHGVLQASFASQTAIDNAARYAAATGDLLQWTMLDNSVVELDALALANVQVLLGARTQDVRGRATALRARIDASQTPAETQSVTWEASV